MINRLAERGLSIIMSSHFPNHALLFSSRVAMMNNGKFIAVGDPERVVTEENLRETYGIDVKIFSAYDHAVGDDIRFCIPTRGSLDVVASGLPGIENVFEGVSKLEKGLARIDIGLNTVIEAVTNEEGKVKLHIPSSEIMVSKRPIKSSGRNVLKGHLVEVSDHDAILKLEVDVGQRLAVLITRKSFLDLGLKVGSAVYVTFKAQAVHVFSA